MSDPSTNTGHVSTTVVVPGEQAMVALAASWYELGVETWVMGLPGSAGATALLDAIAKAGGTEKHMSLGTPDELDAGLHAAAR